MSLAALDRLKGCHEELIGALDGHDVEAIEASVARLRRAVEEVRAAGSWRDNPQVKDRAGQISRLADAARIRVNFLTDLNRGRIDALDMLRGGASGARYGRDGALVR
ncbi:hypothetical protein [Allosphingosinicella sp.]|uniref:hypothetical protein n=1 Tax=Allosphingosinicella sp. TaxID=2823234 RepID=UPI002FC14472